MRPQPDGRPDDPVPRRVHRRQAAPAAASRGQCRFRVGGAAANPKPTAAMLPVVRNVRLCMRTPRANGIAQSVLRILRRTAEIRHTWPRCSDIGTSLAEALMWSVDWDGGFVVGGDGNRRLTPSFRLKEFRRPDGTVRVHRELVSGLQLLRDRFGKPLSVQRTDRGRLGAVVSGEPVAELLRPPRARSRARALRSRRARGRTACTSGCRRRTAAADRSGAGARDRVLGHRRRSRPPATSSSRSPATSTAPGCRSARPRSTSAPGRWCRCSAPFIAADEAALRACFTDPDDYDDWLRVMELPIAGTDRVGEHDHRRARRARRHRAVEGLLPGGRPRRHVPRDHGREHPARLRRPDGARDQEAAATAGPTSRSITCAACARSTTWSCSKAASTRRGTRSRRAWRGRTRRTSSR